MLERIRKLAPRGSYARNIVTLMTGTSLAQAIPIAVSPILTRLYSPEDFGIYALYVAIVSVASVAVTGRYEMAILLPKSDRGALHVVALSMSLSIVISGMLLLLVSVLNDTFAGWLGTPQISPWLYWIPLSTLLTGLYQSLNYWSNRKGQYQRLAVSRVVQSGSGAMAQLGQGYAGMEAAGLIGGQIIGQTLSGVALALPIYREEQKRVHRIRASRIWALAKRYVNFPKYLVFGHSLNVASSQMPVILLTSLFGSATAGFYMLTQRVMGAPLTLIAGALSDVFRQEASQSYIHTGNCRKIYVKTFLRLLVVALPSCMIFFAIAPFAFSLVFGPRWVVAGEYARILTPVLFFKFVTSPLSSMFMISESQRVDLIWQVFLFLSTGGAFLVGHLYSSAEIALMAFSAAYSVMSVASGIISYRLAAGKI